MIREEDEVVLQKGSSLFNIENVEVNQTPTMRDFNVVQHRWSVTFSKSTPKKFSELTEEFNQLLPAIHAKMLQLVTGSNKIFANIYHSKQDSLLQMALQSHFSLEALMSVLSSSSTFG